MMQSTAMERLSTGKRINSAKDDAAGLAIASRMTSQVKGLAVAIRNANDGISLAQTAEGAMGEVTNMLQRMKELAVQSANGTLGTAERAALQGETDQLVGQINDIAKTTNFNGLKLLDGSAKSLKLQTGTNAGDQVTVSLTDVSTTALGLNGYNVAGQLQTGRVGTLTGVADSDIEFNGKAAMGAGSGTLANNAAVSAKDVAAKINLNTANTKVTATAYNTLRSGPISSSGVATGDLLINGATIAGAGDAKTLVTNINRDGKGVTAVLNDDNTITLSNDTGEDIVIAGTTPGNAGFTGATSKGFVSMNSTDGQPIKVTKASGGAATDFANLGLNATDGTTTSGTQVTTGTSNKLTSSDDVSINDVKVGLSADGSAASKAAAINAISSQTGIQASAKTLVKVSIAAGAVGTATINGVSVSFAATDKSTADFVTKINAAGISGVVASTDAETGTLLLTSDSGLDIGIASTNAFASATYADGTTIGTLTATAISAGGSISLSSNTGASVKVEGSAASLLKVGLAAQGGSDDQLSGSIRITTQAGATAALGVIDKALDKISAKRGDLGSIQNRLEVTVNNLSTTSTNLQDARSRIEDADFASETTNLAKSQILSQAATAMLAQANQSQQGVLSLLR
jgi:flagellin